LLSEVLKKVSRFAWFLPGFLLWAAYPPMGEMGDVLFALAPLMWLSRRAETAKVSAKRWFQSGIFYWIATLSWMPAIVKNGGPWPLVILGWFALAAYCSLFFWLYGWLSAKYWCWARGGVHSEDQRIRGRYGLRVLGVLIVEPVLWCGLELVRSRFLGGFAWNQLGVVPINAGFGAPAALGGVYLCSVVVILINGTIAGIAERMWKPERSGFANLKRLGTLETVLAFGIVWGIYSCASLTSGEDAASPLTESLDRGEAASSPLVLKSASPLKVAMIQRNFPCCFKTQEENPCEVYDKLLDNVAMLKPDLVVLPESAMCEFGPVDRLGAMRFAEWVAKKTGGAALLAGGTRYANGNTYNSAALYAFQISDLKSQSVDHGSQSSNVESRLCVYDKVHLVPFGEFIPGDKWFPALQKLAPVGSCTPGELKVLSLPHLTNSQQLTTNNFGIAICFEDTDSAQMRALAAKGAQVLFFITNDSWFSNSIEAEQHAWQAVARAIETGLPVVRVGNSGVTGTITPDGKATWLVGSNGKPLVDCRGTMFDRIVLSTPAPTPYTSFGDWPLGVAFALLIVGMILVKYKTNYEKRRTLSV